MDPSASLGSQPEPSPHRELLDAPDRDRCPGAAPVLAYREDDEPEYLAALEANATARVGLNRRGIHHGQWVALPPSQAGPLDRPADALLEERWHTARPILMPSLLSTDTLDLPSRAARSRAPDTLHTLLGTHGGLRRFLEDSRSHLPPGYRLADSLPTVDRERDIECYSFKSPTDQEHPALWAKSGRLSNDPNDSSLRLRFSFGREGPDDASRNLAGHLAVQELAGSLLPEAKALESNRALMEFLEARLEGPALLTQHIAYWNAPGGGALMHHDAFREPLEGGQRGVVYAQLEGRTAWLALSIEDLARRVIEVVEYMQEGELDWVREDLFPDEETFSWLGRMILRFGRVRKELSKPGCGRLGPLVGRGPEFTALLADAGHAFVLEPGDVLILPNQGLEATCMHSVFCADDTTALGLSLAIRESQPVEVPSTPSSPERGSSKPGGREHRAHGSGQGKRRGNGRRRGRPGQGRARR